MSSRQKRRNERRSKASWHSAEVSTEANPVGTDANCEEKLRKKESAEVVESVPKQREKRRTRQNR